MFSVLHAVSMQFPCSLHEANGRTPPAPLATIPISVFISHISSGSEIQMLSMRKSRLGDRSTDLTPFNRPSWWTLMVRLKTWLLDSWGLSVNHLDGRKGGLVDNTFRFEPGDPDLIPGVGLLWASPPNYQFYGTNHGPPWKQAISLVMLPI